MNSKSHNSSIPISIATSINYSGAANSQNTNKNNSTNNTKKTHSSCSNMSNLRTPRSVSKSSATGSDENDCLSAETSGQNNSLTTNRKIATKRGSSLSARKNKNWNRSMSINPENNVSRETINSDQQSSNNEQKFNADGTRNVKYIVKHKPRESQVKIFSQKLALKNVTSKIGSLENYDHKPAGGSVVVNSY